MLSIEALLRIWVSLYWEMCVLTMILTMCWCWFFSFPFDWLIQFLLVGRFSTFPSENYIILGKLCFLQYLSDLCVFTAFHVLCAFFYHLCSSLINFVCDLLHLSVFMFVFHFVPLVWSCLYLYQSHESNRRQSTRSTM